MPIHAQVMLPSTRWYIGMVLKKRRELSYFLMSSSVTNGAYREVMLAVNFSTKVQNIAAQVVRKMQKSGMPFNGLHLRMEDDIADAVQGEGGFLAAKSQCEMAFRKLHFNRSSVLYVASGLISDKGSGRTSELMTQV